MPLAVRYVEPQSFTAMPLLEAVTSNHLQALNVQNITGVMRQLSSLAKHAESIMGDIADVLTSYHERSVALGEHTRRLRDEIIPSLDTEEEFLEGFEIPHPSLQFKSDRGIDQRILTQQHMPTGLREQYEAIDKTPALHVFTPLWDDQRDALHMYSNPDFFFDHWRRNMQRQTMQRRTTVDLLSPDGGRKQNGFIGTSSPKQVKSTSGSEQLKRTKSTSRSFHRKAHHGSLLSLQDARMKTNRKSKRNSVHSEPSSTPWRSLRASFRRKGKSRPKLEMLTKVTAMAYEGPEVPLAVPDVVIREESEGEEDVQPKRGSFIRRSLSFRKVRRTRSASPAVNFPGRSIYSGMELHTIESDRIKTQSTATKYAMLPNYHLEKLELASSHFDSYLSVDSAPRKNDTTFRVPLSSKGRSVSPFPEFTSKREMLPSSKLASKGLRQRSLTDTRDTSLLSIPSSEKALRRHWSTSSDDRTASSTPPIDPASGQTAVSPYPSSGSPRPLTQSPEGLNLHRPKPKRPAPPRPPLSENRKSCGSISGSPCISPIPEPPALPQQGHTNSISRSSSPTEKQIPKNETQADVEVHKVPIQKVEHPISVPIPIPPVPPPLQGISAVQAVAQETAATKMIEETKPPSTSSKPPPELRRIVRKESLYISSQKRMHTRQKTLDKIPIESLVVDEEKRTSQILKAGGVNDSSSTGSRSDLLGAIRTGIKLKKVEKEETEREKDAMLPWDVAAILERRRAIESDSESEHGDGITEEEWDDS